MPPAASGFGSRAPTTTRAIPAAMIRVGARRRRALVRAGLERHEHRRAPRAAAGHSRARPFGVAAALLGHALADDLAVGDDDGADGRLRIGAPGRVAASARRTRQALASMPACSRVPGLRSGSASAGRSRRSIRNDRLDSVREQLRSTMSRRFRPQEIVRIAGAGPGRLPRRRGRRLRARRRRRRGHGLELTLRLGGTADGDPLMTTARARARVDRARRGRARRRVPLGTIPVADEPRDRLELRLFTEVTDGIDAAAIAETIERELATLLGGATVTIEAERHWPEPFNYELAVSILPHDDPIERARDPRRGRRARLARLPRRRLALRPLVELVTRPRRDADRARSTAAEVAFIPGRARRGGRRRPSARPGRGRRRRAADDELDLGRGGGRRRSLTCRAGAASSAGTPAASDARTAATPRRAAPARARGVDHRLVLFGVQRADRVDDGPPGLVPPRRPGAARAAAPGSGCRRASGGRAAGARTPRPEHGASTSARSKSLSSSSRTSALTTRTFVTPRRWMFSSSSRARPEMQLDGGHLGPSSIVAFAAGRRAGVEDPLAVARADRERGELRAAALPDAALVDRRRCCRARAGRRRGCRSARRPARPSARRARPARSGRASGRGPRRRRSRATQVCRSSRDTTRLSGPGGKRGDERREALGEPARDRVREAGGVLEAARRGRARPRR